MRTDGSVGRSMPLIPVHDITAPISFGPDVITYATDEGQVAPGAKVLFKVYVVLTTANEKGSKTASVTRPDV